LLSLSRRDRSARDRRENPARDRRGRETADRRSGIDRRWPWKRAVTLAVAMWLGLRVFVVQAFDIPSGSMEGTLMTGDVLFVSKATFGAEIPFTGHHLPAFREPKRGEILVFHATEGPWDMVKRMVAQAGDTIAMAGGTLYRNGVKVHEPYAVHENAHRSENRHARALMRQWQLPHYVGADPASYNPDVQNWGPLLVPAGHYFMMGDNRDDSRDSRYWGFLPRANVIGTPLMVYFSHDPASPHHLPILSAIRWDRLFAQPR
jgi:signal peptidase I